jgi:tetratricopeptide (TPR) repeat protein
MFWQATGTLAECLLCQGREADALALMDDCIARLSAANRPDEQAHAAVWRGELRLWIGQYSAALGDLEPAAARKMPYALIWGGAAHLLLGDHARAGDLLDSAARLAPSDAEMYVWRGEVHEQLGRLERAVEDFDRAAQLTDMRSGRASGALWPGHASAISARR